VTSGEKSKVATDLGSCLAVMTNLISHTFGTTRSTTSPVISAGGIPLPPPRMLRGRHPATGRNALQKSRSDRAQRAPLKLDWRIWNRHEGYSWYPGPARSGLCAVCLPSRHGKGLADTFGHYHGGVVECGVGDLGRSAK
jgi:hypothetical protein